MKESELWRKLEKVWREADPNRPRNRWVSPEEEMVRCGLCWSAFCVAPRGGEVYHVMMDRISTIPSTVHLSGRDYCWPLTREYDSVRADWCAKFAEQCEKEEAGE